MDVVPALVLPHETACFVMDSAYAVVPEMRSEFHGALGVERTSVPGGKDIQAAPFQSRIQFKGRRPGLGMPGLEQVFLLQQNEGAVA